MEHPSKLELNRRENLVDLLPNAMQLLLVSVVPNRSIIIIFTHLKRRISGSVSFVSTRASSGDRQKLLLDSTKLRTRENASA